VTPSTTVACSEAGGAPVRVEEVPAEATHDLRWRVLRNRRPEASVTFPEDAQPGAFHLAVRGEDATGAVLAVASFSPGATPYRPGRPSVHLRGMAVDEPFQRHGLGRLLISAVIDRLRHDGVAVLWCNARDSAIGFYDRLGFEVVGEGFVVPESGFAHHVMLRDL
jgi:GNAT superfamily N-acetyltransferase